MYLKTLKKQLLSICIKIMYLMILELWKRSKSNFIKKQMEFLLNNFIMYKPININDTYFRLVE